MDELIREILMEVERSENKFPFWPDDNIHAAAIVCEESGELIRATIQHKYENSAGYEMKTEAIHTAAMCIRFLKNIDK